jgi:hypothetical protein
VSQWDDAYYGRALPDPAAAGALLLMPGLLWAAAERDAAAAQEEPKKYVARVRGRVATFLNTTEADGLPRVINHKGTLAALRVIGEDDGKGLLMLLTGPRSVGKSLMLQKMAKELAQQHRRVLYVDARQYGNDLTRGIIAAVVKDPPFFEKMQKFASGPVMKSMLAMASEMVQQAAPQKEVQTPAHPQGRRRRRRRLPRARPSARRGQGRARAPRASHAR